MCRFSDAGNDKARHTLGRPASEKRQGTRAERAAGALLDRVGGATAGRFIDLE
jgi:hypothetical protein